MNIKVSLHFAKTDLTCVYVYVHMSIDNVLFSGIFDDYKMLRGYVL